jgi:putative ABC transport system permease protein
MLLNFFKTMFRNLRKNGAFSALNIFGLAMGIACAGLIFLWVENETGYDQQNLKKDLLYMAMVNQDYNAKIFTHGSTPGPMGPVIRKEIPGIANTCRTSEGDMSMQFSVGDKSMYSYGRYAEPSLFNMFTLPFLEGNPKNPFPQLHSIVITEMAAKKFFGSSQGAVGTTVRMDNKQDYVVTGLLKDLPDNSTLQFEWVAPFELYLAANPGLAYFGNFSLSTYVELEPRANLPAIGKALYNFVQKRDPTSIGHVFLLSMNDWHLRGEFENGKQTGGGRIEYVHLFSVIAWIILFIACINFMNLATARSEKRAREVGVRKVLGAGKKSLIAQFIGEALFMSLLSAALALALIALLLPAFNSLTQKNLLMGTDNPAHIGWLLGIALVCGLVAGSYPSLYLSSFNPVFVLKGIKLKTGGAALARKGLVVLQFSISIILISGTIIIYQQIQHVKSRDLGFDKNNLLQMGMLGSIPMHFPSVKQDLLNTGLVENVALSDHSTLYGGDNTSGYAWKGKPPGDRVLISWRDVSPEFVKTTGLTVVEGRDFRSTDSTNTNSPAITANVLITQSLADQMGAGSAIGKAIYDQDDNDLHATVIGVVKDYIYGSMYDKAPPVVFFCSRPQDETVLYIRTREGAPAGQALPKIEAVLAKDNPGYPFDYQFVDDQFNNQFQNEMLVSKLSRVFAALAILISCLGLFGLAAYTAERRTKEIGIRKVLGASVAGIAGLLSADFLRLVLLSCVIAFPVAWLAMSKWLEGYSYRIAISGWMFVIAGMLAVLIALVTIGWHAVKAAVANPVKSLRAE